MVIVLSKEENELLEKIKKLKEVDANKLFEVSNLNRGEFERIIQTLSSKNLIKISEKFKRILELSEEGKKYLEEGLPEKNLIKLVASGITNIGDLKLKFPLTDIGIIWAKKLGWIVIYKGEIELTEEGKKYLKEKHPKEDFLEKLRYPRDISEILPEERDYLEEFLKRKLIVAKEKKVRIIVVDKKAFEEEIEVREEIGQLTPQIITSGKWKEIRLKEYDIKAEGKRIYVGKLHPYTQIVKVIKLKLISLGFQEFKGPLVELNFWNCDALFMPSDHPAREVHDIFYLKNPKYGEIIDESLWKEVEQTHLNGGKTGSRGWGYWNKDLARRLILRSQTTSVSARVLYSIGKGKIKPPLKMFVIDKVFRPDVIDPKHFIEFDQLEGIVVDENVNLKHLLGLIKEIAEMFGAEKVRFRPHYFPFTEPSIEVDIYFKELGWVEIAGAGIFRPEVTLPLGVEYPVLAWGIGIGRLALMKLGVNDIRYLMADDLEWIKNHKIIW